MSGLYLVLLIGALGCIGLIDWRYRLALYSDARRSVLTLATSVLIFSLWDIAGIVLKIFFIGDSRLLTGIRIGEYPLEEAFFLLLLSYNTLIAYRFFDQKFFRQTSQSKKQSFSEDRQS